MDERNPYAPSRASLERSVVPPRDRVGAALWRDQSMLIMLPDATMPRRCIKCNGPAHEPTKNRKVYWHHPAIYMLLLLNVIIYAVVAVAVRKKVTLSAGLCAGHKKRRRLAITLGWVGFLAGFALLVGAAGSDGGAGAVILGILVMLGSIVAGMIFGRVVIARRIDTSYVRLKGCGSAFLDSLPPFPG
jgi:hypothetical protein